MRRSALGIIFSLVFALIGAPTAVAASSSGETGVKQHSQKKKLAKKKVSRKTVVASRNSTKKLKKRVVVSSDGRRKVVYQKVAYRPAATAPQVLTAGDLAGLNLTRDPLALKSNAALVFDQSTSQVLFEKNSTAVLPIASITKLMTGLVVVEAQQDMNEIVEVTTDDIDREKHTGSRLRIGAKLSRADMLHIALMSSENRAASALGRHYPGGLPAFVAAMNAKAKQLGMNDTRFVDSTGLSSRNVSSARDLAKLVVAAQAHPILCEYSTNQKYVVDTGGYALQYANSNVLVKNPAWEIMLQKTGYIAEAGRCLVMQAMIQGRAVVMVFLDSKNKEARMADAGRIRKWLEALQPDNIIRASVPTES